MDSNGGIIFFWLIIVLVITILLWNVGANIFTSIAVGSIFSLIIISIIVYQNEKMFINGLISIAVIVIFTFVYFLFYSIYMAGIEIKENKNKGHCFGKLAAI